MDLQPHLRVKKVKDYCLVVGKPERARRISEKFLKKGREVSSHRGYAVYEGEHEGVPVTVCSTGIGGPSAAIAVEELIRAGAKTIIRVGSGGLLRKDMSTGDLVISTGVCKEEKASTSYVPEGFAALPDHDVVSALISSADESGHEYFYGPTMCTDSFYADSHRDTMLEWSEKGVLGSEMESAMIFTICQINGVRAALIFYGGLNILKKQKPKHIPKQEKARSKGEANAIMVALKAIKKLKGGVK